MKTIKTIIFVLGLASQLASAQSISASKILGYLDTQNIPAIRSELTEMGFKYLRTFNEYGLKGYQYSKIGGMGGEAVMVGSNDELFSFTLILENTELYNMLKTKLVTSDFKLVNSYGNTNYFENAEMRIGCTDTKKTLLFYKNLVK